MLSTLSKWCWILDQFFGRNKIQVKGLRVWNGCTCPFLKEKKKKSSQLEECIALAFVELWSKIIVIGNYIIPSFLCSHSEIKIWNETQWVCIFNLALSLQQEKTIIRDKIEGLHSLDMINYGSAFDNVCVSSILIKKNELHDPNIYLSIIIKTIFIFVFYK